MNLKVFKDILGIPGKVWDMNMTGFDLLEDFATGDVDRETIEKAFDLLGDAWDLGKAIETLAQAQAMLGAALAYGMVVAGIQSGAIQIPFAVELGTLFVALQTRVSPIVDKFQAAERRVKGIIDTEAVQHALSLAYTAHTFGMVLSSDYREEIEQLQNSTQQIARRVFGEVSMVNSALTILQMAYYDGARLRGEKVDVAEQDYLKAQIDLLNSIEKKSAKYARSPGLFWYDFNAWFLDPQIRNNNVEQHKRDSRLQGAINGVARVSDASKAIDKSLREYRRELDPFLSKEKARELDAMRRAYQTDVLIPIQTIGDTVKREFPAILAITSEIDESVTNNAENIQDLAEFQTDPSELDPDRARSVTTRWRSMIDNTLGFDGLPPEELQDAQDRIEKIYGEL